jgi:hypothetical protein
MICPRLNLPPRRLSIVLYCFSSDGVFKDLEDGIEENGAEGFGSRIAVIVAVFVGGFSFARSDHAQEIFRTARMGVMD